MNLLITDKITRRDNTTHNPFVIRNFPFVIDFNKTLLITK